MSIDVADVAGSHVCLLSDLCVCVCLKFYLISPKHCHAFVGYLEEEAVKTYTHCLADIDTVRPGLHHSICSAPHLSPVPRRSN